MQVTVIGATNLPEKPVITIHAGNVRRQAKLEVNQPFLIPHPGTQSVTVHMSLLQQLAGQVLPKDNSKGKGTECVIPVTRPDGIASEVKLRICDVSNLSDPGKENCAGMQVEQTQEYLETHKLQQRLQDLIQDVLREQPNNPYRYMVEKLKVMKKTGCEVANPSTNGPEATPSSTEATELAAALVSAEAAKSSTAVPAVLGCHEVPKPPAGPPPEGNPRKARQFAAQDAHKSECQKGKREQARSAARASLGMVFGSSPVGREVVYDQRLQVQRTIALELGTEIMKQAISQHNHGLEIVNSARGQSKVLTKSLYRSSTLLMSWDYRHSIVRWAVGTSIRGACNKIYSDPESRPGCINKASGRRVSLPTPIVYLKTDNPSWGESLSGR